MIYKKINSNVAVCWIPETECISLMTRDQGEKDCERWVAAACSKEDLKKLLEEYL